MNLNQLHQAGFLLLLFITCSSIGCSLVNPRLSDVCVRIELSSEERQQADVRHLIALPSPGMEYATFDTLIVDHSFKNSYTGYYYPNTKKVRKITFFAYWVINTAGAAEAGPADFFFDSLTNKLRSWIWYSEISSYYWLGDSLRVAQSSDAYRYFWYTHLNSEFQYLRDILPLRYGNEGVKQDSTTWTGKHFWKTKFGNALLTLDSTKITLQESGNF